MAILKVAWAGIKKRKVYSISIFLLVFMIALLLNMGLTVMQRTSQIYDETHQKTNAIHVQYLFEEAYGEKVEELEQWFQKDNRIKEVKISNILYLKDTVFDFEGKKKLESPVFLLPNTEQNLMANNEMINFDLGYDEIALPLYYRNKYNLIEGNYFDIFLDDTVITLEIAGFYIEPTHGSEMIGMKYAIVNNDRLKEMIEKSRKITNGQSNVKEEYFLGIVVKDQYLENITGIIDDFYNNNDVPMNASYNIELFKTATLFMPNIILSIMIAFSTLLFLIIVLVIRNAINSAIETDYTNIGILKSLGFTSAQILMTIVLQFSLLSVIGTVLGVSISVLLIPIVGKVVFATTGLIWFGFPSVVTMFILVVSLLMLINCLIVMTSRKIMKITPVEAISHGKGDVYFKPYINIPLNKLALLPLILRIGLKQTLTKVNEYIMLIIISSILSLTIGITLITLSLFSNVETAANIFGLNSKVNVQVKASDEKSVETIVKEISQKYHVLYYDLYSSGMVTVGSKNIYIIVNRDFEKGTIKPTKGRFPKYDNEVTLTKILSKHLGKVIGDTLIISNVTGEEKLEFIITGYHQNITDMGNNMLISAKGLKRIDKQAQLTAAELLIDETLDIDETVNELKELYESNGNGVDITKITYEDTILVTIRDIFYAVVLGICVLVTLIISIITMLLAFIAIYKENRELGVYKALGYDTLQLRLQFAARFGIVTFIGTVIGSTLCYLFGVDLLEMMFTSIGIGRLDLAISLINLLVPIGLVSSVAFLVAFLASKRIKKVSPRELISE